MEDKKGSEEERKFLHDISNHLLVAHGMGSFVDKVVKGSFDKQSKEYQRSQKTIDAIDKIIVLVKNRREAVYGQVSD
jgi:hypothetical protein